jgi:hypothetical protein
MKARDDEIISNETEVFCKISTYNSCKGYILILLNDHFVVQSLVRDVDNVDMLNDMIRPRKPRAGCMNLIHLERT